MEKVKRPIRSERIRHYNHEGKCYVCHRVIKTPHSYYNKMCTQCGDKNLAKRNETSDIKGRIALVTGGRIKIGYQTSLKLLRSGAFVIVTSRFPIDTAYRYYKEEDFENWKDRLKIYKIDFRNIFQIESFTKYLNENLHHLDIIINNAAQTIKRPSSYYEHLSTIENSEYAKLPEKIKALIYPTPLEFDFFKLQQSIDKFDILRLFNVKMISSDCPDSEFPIGAYDKDNLQIDNRNHNSWVSKAADVSTVEMLEVQLINVTAPFLLNTRLKPLLKRSPNKGKFIINVSAMEGKFNRTNKNSFHPHTNMAKASLNMMTRTSAEEYKNDRIYMNSVDTGWITDENPTYIKEINDHKDIKPPIDEIDGASRICDPIFHSLKTGKFSYGRFFKDYHLTNW